MGTNTAELIQPEKEILTEVSGSRALLEALICEGVDTVFGYPGGAICPCTMHCMIIMINLNIYL